RSDLYGARGVAVAIVQLDLRSYSVRSDSQDYDLRPGLTSRFVFFLIRRIHVRRVGLEFLCAGVHALENGRDFVARTLQTDRSGSRFPHLCELFVACTMSLHFAQ